MHYRVIEETVPGGYTSNTGVGGATATGDATFEETHLGQSGSEQDFKVVGTITNTHNPETRTATFTKQWDHKGASDHLTPEQFKNKLHLYMHVVGSAEDPQEVTGTNPDPALFKNTDDSRDNNWKSHTTVTANNDGSYTVEVADLPVNKPKATASAGRDQLEYFITEDAIGNYTRTYPTQATQANGMIGEATETNAESEYLKNERDTGSLQISKNVVSDLAADESQVFNFTISSNPVVTGTGYVVSGTGSTNGQTLDFDSTGEATVSITGSKEVTIAGLPVGVDYTVTENLTDDQTADFDKTCTVSSGGTVASGAGTVQTHKNNQASPDAVAFTNTRKKSDLTLSKSIASAVQLDKTRNYRFEVKLFGLKGESQTYSGVTFAKVAGTNGGADYHRGVITLASGSRSKLIEDLPTDATYEITEIENSSGDTYLDKFDTSWSKTIGTGNPSTTVAGGTFPGEQTGVNTVTVDDVTIDCVNTRKTGTLRLVKTVNSPFPTETGAAESGYDTYNFKVALQMPQNLYSAEKISGEFNATGVSSNTVTFDANGEATVAVRGGTGATAGQRHYVEISGLPIDVEYTVTEENPNQSIFDDPVVSYHGKIADPSTGTSGTATSPYTIEEKDGTYSVEITNTRIVVPVSLYKVSAINESKLGGAEFSLSYIKDANDADTTGDDHWTVQLRSDASTGCLVETSRSESTQVFSLKPGTYQLVETKAPIGYHPRTAPIEFKVTPNGVEYTDSIAENGENVVKVEDGTNQTKRVVNVSVYNATDAELPSTGGPGTLGDVVGSFLLLALAGAAGFQGHKPELM